MKDEQGPRTPFELSQHVRSRIPEIFRGCGFEKYDLVGGWRVENGALFPNEEDLNLLEVEVHFFTAVLDGWLRRAARMLERENLISPLLLAWDERLREMIEDGHAGRG